MNRSDGTLRHHSLYLDGLGESSGAALRQGAAFTTRAGTHFKRCGIPPPDISAGRFRIGHERPTFTQWFLVMTDFNILELIVRLQPTLKRGSLKMVQAVLADPTLFAHASLASA